MARRGGKKRNTAMPRNLPSCHVPEEQRGRGNDKTIHTVESAQRLSNSIGLKILPPRLFLCSKSAIG